MPVGGGGHIRDSSGDPHDVVRKYLTYQFHDEKHYHFPTHLLLFRKTSPLTYLIYNIYGSKNV